MLKCYDCMEEGKDNEAVSICIVCGKGLCLEHTKIMELPIWTGKYPMPVKMLDKGLPRVMCNYCLTNTLVDAFD